MKRFAVALAAAALVIGFGGSAHAQEIEPEVEIEAEPAAGTVVPVTVSGAEPDATIDITLGDQTASGAADADGNAEIDITIPDTPGELDGVVTINGVDVPVSVVIQAAAGADDGAGTATDLPSTGLDDTGTLAALAAGLLLAGTAFYAISRRTQAA